MKENDLLSVIKIWKKFIQFKNSNLKSKDTENESGYSNFKIFFLLKVLFRQNSEKENRCLFSVSEKE